MDLDRFLDQASSDVKGRFERAERVKSFADWLSDFTEAPGLHLRCAAQYVLEMFDHFGRRPAPRVGQEAVRFELFDLEASHGSGGLAGQERIQNEIYQFLQSFAKRGRSDKMLLLHGPNGSGKTTIVDCIIRGLELFSQTDKGALYSFRWVFSERDDRFRRIGFEASDEELSNVDTFAYLEEADITSRISCELRDSPLYLLPRPEREKLIAEVLERHPVTEYPDLEVNRFLEGDLCQKCRRIYDSLLTAYQGDWQAVVRHVQVERFFVSKRYRSAAVSIEPQGNIDAGTRPILSEQSWSIPTPLRNVSLYEPMGDLVDANRGIVEYSDFLKRPMEANKYLLTTCEQGTVHLSQCLAYLDLAILGTANTKQLDLFKMSPDFPSFKGRIELIPVPYLLRFSTESELYGRHIRSFARGRHVTPHAAGVGALWAVLTRLRRPRPESFEEPLRGSVVGLTPLEKAKLYDSGEVPDRLTEEQRRVLRASILEIRREFEEDEREFEGLRSSEYEGRRGASPREMMGVLSRAAEARTYRCLTPMAVFDAVEELLQDTSVHDFLRIPADDRFQDMPRLLEDVRTEYFRWVTSEVYDSIELIDEGEYDRLFLDYFRHVKAFHTGETVKNTTTGVDEPPDESFMAEIERQVAIQESADEYRSDVMTRIAAWSLDHPGKPLDYHALFPRIHGALRADFYRTRNRLLTLIEQDIVRYGTDEFELLSPSDQAQVLKALTTMQEKYGYCDHCARDVIAYVLKNRPETEAEPDAEAPSDSPGAEDD